MSFGFIDLLFNLTVMLFWVRAWNADEQSAPLNPYLAWIFNFVQPVLEAARRGLRAARPAPIAAALCFALLAFRAAALLLSNPERFRPIWRVGLGFETIALNQCGGGAFAWLAFSALSFAVFLFYVWSCALVFRVDRRSGWAADFVFAAARPYSSLPPAWRPLVLLAYGLLLVLAMKLALYGGGLPPSAARAGLTLLKLAVAVAAGLVDLLLVLQSALFILIIGSWITLAGAGGALATVCREWLDFLLAPFRGLRLQLGFLDLTPIIVLFALGLLHWAVNGVFLANLYLYLQDLGA